MQVHVQAHHYLMRSDGHSISCQSLKWLVDNFKFFPSKQVLQQAALTKNENNQSDLCWSGAVTKEIERD